MRLYEIEGKELLRSHGFRAPQGVFAASGETVPSGPFAFPLMVKAQVLSGGRGKRGLVATAQDMPEVLAAVHRFEVGIDAAERYVGVLLEEYVAHTQEVYLSVTVNPSQGTPVVLVSRSGGVDVENQDRDTMSMIPFDPTTPPWPYEICTVLQADGYPRRLAGRMALWASRLAKLAMRLELSLLEINPLFVLPDGALLAGDVKVDVGSEDAGPAVGVRIPRTSHPVEERAMRMGMTCIPLLGRIGVITGGAGLGMMTVDALYDAGLPPADFFDTHGATEAKMQHAVELVGSLPDIDALLINNAAGLSSCMALAQGIAAGLTALPNQLPAVVKLRGAYEQAAWDFLRREVPWVDVVPGGLDDAVQVLAHRLRGVEA